MLIFWSGVQYPLIYIPYGYVLGIGLKGHWTTITSIFFISNSIEDFKLNQ